MRPGSGNATWPISNRRRSLSEHRQATRRLWFWHMAAVATLIALVVSAHALTRAKIAHGAHYAEIINIAGRQRMLSQRILYFGEKHYYYGDADSAGMLVDATDEFEAGHVWLLENAVLDGPIADYYFDPDAGNLNADSRAYIDNARALIAEAPLSPDARSLLSALAGQGETTLLDGLNEAVSLFEGLADAENDSMMRLQSIIAGFTVILLVAEVLFIFRPAARAVWSAIKRLDVAANADSLTGLANRKRLWELLDERLSDRGAAGEDLVVVNIDLDGFKAVNDSLGHPAGDALLVHVARLLETLVGDLPGADDPVIARLGGDEFVVAFCTAVGEGQSQAEKFGERILQAVRQPVDLDLGESSEPCVVGMSLGYALASESVDSLELLVANADIALYRSKRAGKNRMTRFEPYMREAAEQRHRLETQLREAVRKGEFAPFYQPQVSLKTGAITGVEVMIRWMHPERGPLTPDAFFAAASDLGLMEEIEGTVVLQALEDLAQLRDAGQGIPCIAINASLPLLGSADYVEALLSKCAVHGFAPRDLVLEISDADLLQATGTVVFDRLTKLSAAGFRVAIDGFGIGGSTLQILTSVDLTGLKLARELVTALDDSRTERMIAASVAVAGGIGLEVAAVGVETNEQVARMRALGCTAAQGRAIAEPGDAESLACFLESRRNPDILSIRSK